MGFTTWTSSTRIGPALALCLGALQAAPPAGSLAIGLEISNESGQPWTLRTVEASGIRDPRALAGHVDYQLAVREFWSDTLFQTRITAPSPGPGTWTLQPVERKRELDPAFLHYRVTPTALQAGAGGTFYFCLGGGNGIFRLFKVTCTYAGPSGSADPYRMTFAVTPQATSGAGAAQGVDPEDLAVTVDESRRRLTIKRDGYPGR